MSPRRGAAPAESVLRWLGDQQYADGSLGLPVNVTINRTAAAMPDGNNSYQRPDRVAGMSIYAKNRTPQNWLNLAAFATPANGTWGNTPKNAVLGPNDWHDDMAMKKNFHLVEKFTLNLWAEAFNIFNRPQWVFRTPTSARRRASGRSPQC